MFFFFKKPKIVVDCFTAYESVYNLYKIRKANAFYPDNIKSVPAVVKTIDSSTNIEYDLPTIKRCEGINDLYGNGAIIPFWSDFISQPKKHAKNECSIGLISFPYAWTTHPRQQYPGILEDYTHVKFNGVWNIRENTGVKFIYTSAWWNLIHHKDHFLLPPAIVDYKTQNQTNLNIFINNSSEDFQIKGGEPIIHIIPMTEKHVEYNCHLISHQEMDKINRVPTDFSFLTFSRNRTYYKHLKTSQELDKKEKGKCPFGFGK